MSDGAAAPDPLPTAARRWRGLLLALALLIAGIDFWALLHAPRALDPQRAGSVRAELDWHDAERWRRVSRLDPASPLAAAGVQPGDHLRFEHLTDAPGWRSFDTQERLTIEHRPAGAGGAVRTITVTPVPDPAFDPGRALLSYLTGWTARLVSLALAVLIVLRRPADRALRGLALALMASNVFGWYFLPGGSLHDTVDLLVRPVAVALWTMGLLWMALHYAAGPPWPAARWRTGLLALNLGLLLLSTVLWAGVLWAWWTVPQAGWVQSLWSLTVGTTWGGALLAGSLSILWALAWGCRHAQGAQRARLRSVTLAMGALLGPPVLMGLLEPSPLWPTISPYQWAVGDVSQMTGAALLVWAVLRHRAFDLGVALQRTVALSVVSTALLTALGLGKWLAERLLHEAGVPRGPWADLLLALLVVGAFAAVQKPLLARVDALVFRRWHGAAAALRHFVDRATHVTRPEVLRQRFVEAVDQFAEARGSAVLVAQADGALHAAASTLPGAPLRLDADDVLAVELRHGTRRVDLTRLPGSAAAAVAEWAFVMSVRGRVSGALLVSARPDGVAYRPEELTQLEDSTRRIGLDLDSLRVDELERELQALRAPAPGA